MCESSSEVGGGCGEFSLRDSRLGEIYEFLFSRTEFSL